MVMEWMRRIRSVFNLSELAMIRYQGILLLFFCFLVKLAAAQEPFSDTANGIKLVPLKINSRYNDYSPLVYENQLIFCSNNRNTLIPYYSQATGEMLDHILITDIKGENLFSAPQLLLKNFPARSMQGPATISRDGKVLYFTGSCMLNEQGCESGKSKKLRIYKTEFDDAKKQWNPVTEFPYNLTNYSVGHPALSPDGTVMIFASNQPGGFGKSDLYITRQQNGRWTKPKNMGPAINTSSNESFPYISKDNVLYFSSDRPGGLGKFDLYAAPGIGDSIQKKATNLGAPFNSAFDDFGYTEGLDESSGYLSSNRKNGQDDDIYYFTSLHPECVEPVEYPFCYTFFEEGTLNDESLPLVYEWDLGDGNRKRGLEINHCYERPGNYIINLNIIDTTTGVVFFNEASYDFEVRKLTQAHMDIGGEMLADKLMEFRAENANIPNCSLTSYYWDFGDGGQSEGISVLHVYEQNGEFEVVLTLKGKTLDTRTDCQACVHRKIQIGPKDKKNTQLAGLTERAAEATRVGQRNMDTDSLTYKVELMTSRYPLGTDSSIFSELAVSEYKDQDLYRYVVGNERDLSTAYPLFADVREKGFTDARIVAFKGGKIITGKDTSSFGKTSVTRSFTQIEGKIIDVFGKALCAEIILENLTTGEVLGRIYSDPADGRFYIILPNEELYGFFAELKGYYSVSNYIDLRNEKRNLEIKKDIEMVSIEEMNDLSVAVRLNNIFFAPNEYRLKKESYPELNRLVRLIRNEPGASIEIAGHTDNSGNKDYNTVLSEKRATAVKEYLVHMGIDASRIMVTGYGDQKPVASNNSERGKLLNRRVEFRLIYN